MRIHRCVPMLAAVVSLSGVSAPVAYGFEAMSPGGDIAQPAPVVQHHSGSSIDWVIGIGTATGIVVLGTGAAATMRNRRPAATPTRPRAASR
jgi:hypothetical protein